MAGPLFFDRVMETTTTTGTGTLTLAGAVVGFQTFAAVGNGNLCPYAAWAIDGSGVPTGEWETGFGTYTSAGTTLARTVVLASSNSGSAVNFSAGTKRVALTVLAAFSDIDNSTCTGRLTLTSGTAVTSADVTAATNVVWTPYKGNRVALYDGAGWRLYRFSELTLALGTLSSGFNYDVFLFDNAGTLTLEAVAWTNDTTRATALVLQDGVHVKSGTTTKRYLGTFRTTSTTTTEDSGGGTTSQVGGKRFLWNMYNRVDRHANVIDATNSWTYTTDAWRYANNNAGNRIEYVCGLAEDHVFAVAIQAMDYPATTFSFLGIGVDSSTVKSGQGGPGYNGNLQPIDQSVQAQYRAVPGLGYHFIAWIENGSGSPAGATFYGDNNEANKRQSGMFAVVRG